MTDFLMPSLGADMAAGTLVSWKIRPGDIITRGQVVAEVETDKGVIDVECFEAGTVERLVGEPGQKLPVGAVLAVIRTDLVENDRTSAVARAPATPAEAATASLPVETPPIAASAATTQRIKATPAARRRAAELGVDLGLLSEIASDRIVELADVERIAASQDAGASSTSPDEGRTRMRRAIAAAMSKANREIPHFYLETRIDLSRAISWVDALNAARPVTERVLPSVLPLKAVALALRDIPELNGFWIDDRRQTVGGVHLGLAISMRGGGLVAPAIHDADRKSLDELMAVLHDLIPRARAGRLRSSELTDATATLTNLGDLGVEKVFGVIYPPQIALIGFGKISPQPWVVEGAVCVRPVVTATLAADHRATDGRRGAQFLEAVNRHLQSPELL